MKAKGSLTNTHYVETVGRVVLGDELANTTLTVRFTSDSLGEAISIADEEIGIMLVVPFEPVEKIIKDARKEKERDVN